MINQLSLSPELKKENIRRESEHHESYEQLIW